MVNNYIWLFGENLGKTADNNSFYLWKKVVNINDDVEKYIIFERNKNTLETYVNLTEYEKNMYYGVIPINILKILWCWFIYSYIIL